MSFSVKYSLNIVLGTFLTSCGTSGKEPISQCCRIKRCRFHPWVRKIPWRRKWPSTPGFLPGESHGQRNLVGYRPYRIQSSARQKSCLSGVREDMDRVEFEPWPRWKESACNAGDPGAILGREDPLEKGMVTHSSILARKISWTEEPGRLRSAGLQRVRHD